MPITKPAQKPVTTTPERAVMRDVAPPKDHGISKKELAELLGDGQARLLDSQARMNQHVVDVIGNVIAGKRRVRVHSIERDREGRITSMLMDVVTDFSDRMAS